ncbi:MAG: hypothetical protein J0L92_02175 [Deltaproteobacteria bacterium]|nr:hypothetical protein [Deltaproteobacteria bacterium]
MRLSPQLLCLVAGTAAVASLGTLTIGCTESRAVAAAPVARATPLNTPAPAMRPIDFEAPPVVEVTETEAVSALPVTEVTEVSEEVTELATTEPPMGRPRRAPRNNPDPDLSSVTVPMDQLFVGIGPGEHGVAANCGRG